MASNATTSASPDLGRPQSQARVWFEPLLIVCIMLGSLIINRRRSYTILRKTRDLSDSAENLIDHSDDDSMSDSSLYSSHDKTGRLCGLEVSLPDTSRFADYPFSRLLQKFPFLIEMFYWVLNYVAYALTKQAAASIYGQGDGHQVTAMAQDNGIAILTLEHDSIFSFFFPIKESTVQAFILQNHHSLMTFFNQIYSLVHIPGTVLFLSWYYYAAPNHDTFAVARRTMTLSNFAGFIIFCLYPCMPPRLLPTSFGFKDTVRQEHAESVWVGGSNVNQLAAMPSLHFTYAFVVGSTFFYHSGIWQAIRGTRSIDHRRTTFGTVAFALAAFLYPALVLTVIVSTANHYYLDAVVATAIVAVSFCANRIWLFLLPAERLLCWVLRVKKPEPTTGQRHEAHRAPVKLRQSMDTRVNGTFA